MIRVTRRYLRLSWPDRLLLLYVLVVTGLLRSLVLLVPFRFMAPYLGRHMAESSQDDPGQYWYLRRVSWAIETVAKRTPWESKCLVQAITAKLLLRRKGIKNTLYLGVAKDGDSKLIAHAWLRAGGWYITGGIGRERYIVVATFADD